LNEVVQMSEYGELGRWVTDSPRQCANPDNPHPLAPLRTLNGWVDCRCGGHRTVRCLAYDDDMQCNAVHYLPALRPACVPVSEPDRTPQPV
jgi:hypothetical protein